MQSNWTHTHTPPLPSHQMGHSVHNASLLDTNRLYLGFISDSKEQSFGCKWIAKSGSCPPRRRRRQLPVFVTSNFSLGSHSREKHMTKFRILFTMYVIPSEHINDVMVGACSTYAWKKNAQEFWWENMKERHRLTALRVDGKTLNWSYRNRVGCCECGNEPSHSIKCGELLEQQTTVSFSSMARLQAVSGWVNNWLNRSFSY